MIPEIMNEDMVHEVDELLLKFETTEELEELVSYIESEIAKREFDEGGAWGKLP